MRNQLGRIYSIVWASVGIFSQCISVFLSILRVTSIKSYFFQAHVKCYRAAQKCNAHIECSDFFRSNRRLHLLCYVCLCLCFHERVNEENKNYICDRNWSNIHIWNGRHVQRSPNSGEEAKTFHFQFKWASQVVTPCPLWDYILVQTYGIIY